MFRWDFLPTNIYRRQPRFEHRLQDAVDFYFFNPVRLARSLMDISGSVRKLYISSSFRLVSRKILCNVLKSLALRMTRYPILSKSA